MRSAAQAGGRRGGARRAAAAVEMALILPLLLLLALGCVDFGRFAYCYIALTNAARAGAAYAIMNPYLSSDQATWASQVQETARDEMEQQTKYTRTQLTTVPTTVIEATGLRRVRVEASYDSFRTIVPWPTLPSQVVLKRAVEMYAIR